MFYDTSGRGPDDSIVFDILLCVVLLDPFKSFFSGFKAAIKTRSSLHWLRVPERIQIKIAVMAYIVLHSDAPLYLGPFTSTADVPGRLALRSAGTKRLVVSSVRQSTVGSRAFPVAAA